MTPITAEDIRYQLFKKRTELNILYKILLAFGMACLTGLFAQIAIPLPFSPVPITGQTLAVLLSGVLVGKNWGAISQVMYVGFGCMGIPWFSGMTSGFSILWGATGGYLLGFVLAAWFLGHLTENYLLARRWSSLFLLMFLTNVFLIFLPGLIHLWLWLSLAKENPVSLVQLLNLGFLPFLPGALVKVFLATNIGWFLLPKTPYAQEKDSL